MLPANNRSPWSTVASLPEGRRREVPAPGGIRRMTTPARFARREALPVG